MNTLKTLFKNNIRQYGMIIALVSIMLLFQILTDGILLKPLNITNLIQQNSYILILAVGMLMVIITGNIDLSVGSVAAFVGAFSAVLMVQMKVPFGVALTASLIIGACVGAWHGFWIAYLKIPAFIVTLAGMLIFRGLTNAVLQGRSLGPFPEVFRAISTGFIPDYFGGGQIHILSLLVGIIFSLFYVFSELRDRKAKLKHNFEVIPKTFLIAKIVAIVSIINLFTYVLATYKGIPNILVLLCLLVAIYSFITDKTVIGRHIYS
jgi:putative multiple sugar transport system permease protein